MTTQTYDLLLAVIQNLGLWVFLTILVILMYRLLLQWMAKAADPTRNTDWLLARTQVGTTLLFSLGFFSILFFLMVYHKEMSTIEVTILTGLLSSLATIVALQQNFLFARTRPNAIPAPPPIGSPPSAPTLSLTVKPGDPNASPPSSSSATATSGSAVARAVV